MGGWGVAQGQRETYIWLLQTVSLHWAMTLPRPTLPRTVYYPNVEINLFTWLYDRRGCMTHVVSYDPRGMYDPRGCMTHVVVWPTCGSLIRTIVTKLKVAVAWILVQAARVARDRTLREAAWFVERPACAVARVHPMLLVLVDPRPVAVPSEKARIAHDRDPLPREVHLGRLPAPGHEHFRLHEVLAVHFYRPAGRAHSEFPTGLSAIGTAPDRGVVGV